MKRFWYTLKCFGDFSVHFKISLLHVYNILSKYLISLLILNLLLIPHFSRTLAAAVLSVGVINFREVNDVRDHFSADNSPSRYEFAVALEFFRELGEFGFGFLKQLGGSFLLILSGFNLLEVALNYF